MGQSTPFILDAIQGRLPAQIECLPPGTREVSYLQESDLLMYQVPATTNGDCLAMPITMLRSPLQDDLIDSITEPKRREPAPESRPSPENDQPPLNNATLNRREVAELVVGGAATGAIILLLIQYGIPILLNQLRRIRQNRGREPLLSQEQFEELVERLQELTRGLAVVEAKFERKDGSEP